MKKIFAYSIACFFAAAFQAQEIGHSDDAYLERCRNFSESIRETGREFRANTHKNCTDTGTINYINQGIEDYKNALTDKEKNHAMRGFAQVTCPKAIDYYEKIILSDTSEIIRCQAMQYLGWTDAKERIVPFLLDYYKKPNLSANEKVRIATTLIVQEAYDDGEKIANENCFDTTDQLVDDCVFCYQTLGNNSSIKYFRYMHKISGGRMNWMWWLVYAGDKETALPAIKASLKKDRSNKKYELDLLKIIGDEESISLIKNALNDPHENVRKQAETVLKSMEIETKKE